MEELESRTDRARYHENVKDVYEALHGNDPEQSPFATNKDVFMLAASIGFNKGLRKKLDAGKKESMRMEIFTDKDKEILKGIALADTQDIHVLNKKPEEIISGQVLTIVEEYAHGGINELRRITSFGASLWNLVDLTCEKNEL